MLISSVLFSDSVVSDYLSPHGLQHGRLPCPSPTPGACSNSCPLSLWCHPNISFSVILFSHFQSFPASGSFPRSQSFTSSGQSIGASDLALVLPMIIQDWFHLGWNGWISYQSQGLSRVFSNTTVQKYWFFGTQLPLKSTLTSYMTTGKTVALTRQTVIGKVMFLLFNMLSSLVTVFFQGASIF